MPAARLRSGIGRSQYDDTGALWQQAIGFNPFLIDDNSRFLGAITATPTRIGSADFTDIPLAYTPVFYGSNAAMCILGSSGRFYIVFSDNTYVVVRPQSVLTALSNATGGMAPVIDSGGNSYVFACCRQDLVRWDLDTADSGTHWNVGNNGLTLSNHHPMKRVFNYTYFGNGNYLGRIDHTKLHNQATTLTNVDFTLINFGTDQIVTTIGEDGRYTLIATSKSFDEATSATTDARIVWYPNIGVNWDWEVTLKGERAIRAIVRNALGTFAICEQNIYQLVFGEQPKLIRPFDILDAPGGAFNAIVTTVGPRANASAPYGNAMIFGKRGAVFGKRYPSEPLTFSHPLQGHTSTISMIAPDFVKDKIFVGTEDSKFWVYDMTSAGSTSNSQVTDWIDLGAQFLISALEIELPQGIGSSDVLGIKVEVRSGDSCTLSLSQTTVASRDRTNLRRPIKPTLKGSQVRFTFTPSAGSPKFGSLSLYGKPAKQ